ncbi:multidrug ABC transporter ATP-binding protein, partial [Salmonella enterica subsp. enterica]
SHSRREASYVRSAMQEFMQPVYAQGRLISAFEIVNHTLIMMLIVATTGLALYLWSAGQIGIGAVAAATAMAMRLNGISQWAMWE